MRAPQPALQGHSIVLIGNFTPTIFQPAWFAAEELVRKQEAEEANFVIGHPDLLIFTLEWLRLEVTRERLIAETTMEPYDEILRDLVLGTFRLLSHTPIRFMGINRQMHFRMHSEEEWHQAGHTLAPKDIWDGILENAGTRSITIEESQRRDGLKGYIRVTVGPSTKIEPGVFIRVNDHFEVENPESPLGNSEIMSILESRWSESYKRSEEMMYSLLEKLS